MRMLLRQKTNVYAYDTFELCKNNDLFFFGLYSIETDFIFTTVIWIDVAE